MKKIFVLTLLVSSTSIFATSPTLTPQNLEKYKGNQENKMSRLRVSLAVSSNNDQGEMALLHKPSL